VPGRGSSGHDTASAELHVSSLVHVSPILRSRSYRLMWITARTRRGSRLRDHASKALRPRVAARPPRHRAAPAFRHAHRSSRRDRVRASAQTVDLASRPLRRVDETAEFARRKPEARYFYYRCGTQWDGGECTHKKLCTGRGYRAPGMGVRPRSLRRPRAPPRRPREDDRDGARRVCK
jgi:hypothetical protein